MSISSFKKENLHCVWDDSLQGKTVLCSDTLSGLHHLLECEDAPGRRVTPSSEISYPFFDGFQVWRLTYVIEKPAYNPGDDGIKLAYLQGHSVMRRFLNEEWLCVVPHILTFRGIDTTYMLVADDIDCEVPDGYKVMTIGGSVWLEPNDDVICK